MAEQATQDSAAQPNTPAQTAQTERAQAPAVYARPIPMPWLLGFVIFLIVLTVVSLKYTEGNGPMTIVNILLGLLAGGALWLLWLTPSGAGRLEVGEVFLGLFLLFVGFLAGGSATLQPYSTKIWSALHLDPRLANPITAPNDACWEYNGTFIVPKNLPPQQRLVIKTPTTPNNGLLLTEDGYDVKGLKTVTMWLQDQSTGQTSSSILFHVKPEVTNPPATP